MLVNEKHILLEVAKALSPNLKKKNFLMLYFVWKVLTMDYKKKSIKKMDLNNSYEEIDTRLASGWYVDSVGINKKKKYKTKEVSFKISKKSK